MNDPGADIHALEHHEFLERVHSFEFWFQAVEGYLAGTTYGHRPETAESPMSEAERDRLVGVLCTYCVGETAALEGASGLIPIAPDRLAKIFLATQVADEGRHLEVLQHRMRRLGVTDVDGEVTRRASRSLVAFRVRLQGLVEARDWEAALLAQNVILESLEFAVFHHHAQRADAVTAEILGGIIKDERRHMGFGENVLGRRLVDAPHTRRRLQPIKRELDHLMLDTIEHTAGAIGVPLADRARLGRAYLESAARLGFLG